jgi:hypothetical protein
VAARPRAAATPLAPVATPVPLAVETAPLSPPVREYVPATPPPAVYTPSVQPPMPATPPAWSVPAPARPADTLRGPIGGGRAGIELRAREQAVRAAQARYRRAEAAASSVENADGEADGAVLEELEQAARDLREAEAALDRVRRRPAR